MHDAIQLKKCLNFHPEIIIIPGSKSESNRALIISALSRNKCIINNLSSARDTQTLASLLNNKSLDQNVQDAGTTMRFLTAFYSATNQHKILHGTARMHERPIKILVDALIKLGAKITYLEKKGFPPIEIFGLNDQKIDKISVPGNVSSQYISALLMIAPVLPKGLKIELEGDIGSKPYIDMTLQILSNFGVIHHLKGKTISIPPQSIKFNEFEVEPDWSGASYWYAFVSLANNVELSLPGLNNHSLQGDKVISEIMTPLGVKTNFNEAGVHLSKSEAKSETSIDFTDCPDLAQTIAVVCAAKKIKAKFKGIRSLKIKETNRIEALRNELTKLNCTFKQTGSDEYIIVPGDRLPNQVVINTYDDHRMAMAFAPLCMLMDVEITHPEVVEKSYPSFWTDVALSGVEIINI